MRFRGYSAIESAETIMLFLDHGRGSDLVRRGGKAMCRATQKAACRVPVTCRCVTGVRPHTRHAPRGPESGAREQSAAVPPPPGPAPALASTSGPAQRGAALLCPTATVRAYSERPGRRRGRESARGGAGRGGQGRPTRTALGIPTVAIRHTATQALSGGPATNRLAHCPGPGPAASPPVRGPSLSRAAGGASSAF